MLTRLKSYLFSRHNIQITQMTARSSTLLILIQAIAQTKERISSAIAKTYAYII